MTSGNSLRQSLNAEPVREREYLDPARKVISLSPALVARARELTASDRRLASWLHRHLRCAGALNMVKTYGAKTIIATLFEEGIMEEVNYIRPHEARFGRQPRYQVDPELHRPGGFLRFVLRGGA